MKYAFIQKYRSQFSINKMCKVLGCSRKGFYDWASRSAKPSIKKIRTDEIDRLVKEMFYKHKRRLGSPRITRELRRGGVALNKKTVAQSMRRQGLKALSAKKFKATTNSRHNLPVAPDLLKQEFTAEQPNQKWVQDITYLETTEGWSYLAVVIDLYSRMVVGWSYSKRMNRQLVCDALSMALSRRGYPENVIVHSDRGSQYCSNDFQNLIKKYNLKCSMSRKGCCYDNACAESFFKSLKVEEIYCNSIQNREKTKQAIFRYIESYYNRVRPHSTLDYKTPVQMEAA